MIDVSAFVETLNGKPVAVFGLGVSGQATVKALEAAGAKVITSDDKSPDSNLDEEALKGCACLVLSPGVPLYFPEPHSIVKAARAAGIEIISDIEVFGRSHLPGTVIGITGTNGKSTTAALLHHVLKECGMESQLGGNIGKAVLDMDTPSDKTVFVLELSSYQLDLCPTFAPHISVLLNISPDHLARHGSMENYVASKAQIFEGEGEAVIAVDDGYTKQIAKDVEQKGARNVRRVSSKDIDFETDVLKGTHNQQNIAAVMAVADLLDINQEEALTAIKSFKGLPHRQYPVRTIGDVTYINDSKATNPEAVAKALSSYDNIYWILGGQAKDCGLKGLESLVERVEHAYLIGQECDAFPSWLEAQGVAFSRCGTMEKAVQQAHDMSQDKAGTVILSPACASWDQYSCFAARGDEFMKLVNAL